MRDRSGAPVRGICIDTWGGEEKDVIQQRAKTDARGRYEIERSSAETDESYWFEAIRFRDCRRSPSLAFRWAGDAVDLAEARRFPEGEPASGINARLPVGGSLSGRVTDDEGDAIGGICVRLYDGTWEKRPDDEWRFVAYAEQETRADGTYRFRALASKRYRILFYSGDPRIRGCGDGKYRSEWYDDKSGGPPEDASSHEALEWPSSTPVTVTEGSATPNIDARLAAAGLLPDL